MENESKVGLNNRRKKQKVSANALVNVPGLFCSSFGGEEWLRNWVHSDIGPFELSLLLLKIEN